jgi:hypothetical protein
MKRCFDVARMKPHLFRYHGGWRYQWRFRVGKSMPTLKTSYMVWLIDFGLAAPANDNVGGQL